MRRSGRDRRRGPAARARLTAASLRLAARCTTWVETELLGLPALVPPGGVCVDVGAAAGLYTLLLSRLAGPAGQVHSVEPLSFAHPGWARLLHARAAGNVHPHALALAAEPGSGAMSVPVGRCGPVTGRSFLTRRARGLGSNAEFGSHLTVGVTVGTLDGLCAGAGLTRLDFVKIDVEGAELQVLAGGQQAIESFRPALLIEIEARHTARYGYTPAEITGWLTRRGYVMHTWQQGWREAGAVCGQTRNYLFRMPGGEQPRGISPATAPASR